MKTYYQPPNRFQGTIGMLLYFMTPFVMLPSISCFIYQIVQDKSQFKLLGTLLLILYQYTGVKKSKLYVGLINYFRPKDYFKSWKVIFQDQVEDHGNILCFHPHSVFCFPAHVTLNDRDIPLKNFTFVGSRMAISAPFIGIHFRWWGFDAPNPENFQRLMQENQNIGLIPGGFEEASATSDQEYSLYLHGRKGFIKYALQNGYQLRPVMIFNQNRCYKYVSGFLKLQLLLNQLKLPGNLFFSKYLGVLPDPNVDVVVLICKAIEFPMIENPTDSEIKFYHKKYIAYVSQLFDQNKPLYDDNPDVKLQFIYPPQL